MQCHFTVTFLSQLQLFLGEHNKILGVHGPPSLDPGPSGALFLLHSRKHDVEAYRDMVDRDWTV